VVTLWGAAALGTVAIGLVSLFAGAGWPRAVLVAGLAFELLMAAREMEYNRPGDPELYLGRPAVVSYLEAAAGRSSGVGDPLASRETRPLSDRVLSIAVEERLDPVRLRLAAPPDDGQYRHYAAMREALKPSLGLAYGLPTVDGYDGGLLPTRHYAQFKSLLVRLETPVTHYTLPSQLDGKADQARLGALNVRYVLTDGRNGSPGPGWLLRESAPGAAWLYENVDVTPRAFLVDDVTAAPADDAAAVRLLAGLDLTREALVDVSAGALPAISPGGLAAGGTAGPAGLTRRAQIVRYSPQELEIQTEADAASLLVVTDSYYPGWRASVDGRPATILRTNVLFRGVPVPAGAHRVRLWFDPLSVRFGLALSTIGLLANGAALLFYARRRRLTAGRGTSAPPRTAGTGVTDR
jgi:hypothetical protein